MPRSIPTGCSAGSSCSPRSPASRSRSPCGGDRRGARRRRTESLCIAASLAALVDLGDVPRRLLGAHAGRRRGAGQLLADLGERRRRPQPRTLARLGTVDARRPRHAAGRDAHARQPGRRICLYPGRIAVPRQRVVHGRAGDDQPAALARVAATGASTCSTRCARRPTCSRSATTHLGKAVFAAQAFAEGDRLIEFTGRRFRADRVPSLMRGAVRPLRPGHARPFHGAVGADRRSGQP